jgi:threonine/homoserine/homoserine lactone efflux protein
MDLALLLRGMVIGFSLAAPVGPIGVLTIRRTLAHGRLTGFVSGLGTATADALYGLIGALGITSLTSLLTAQSRVLGLVGGAFLVYLGARTFLARPAAFDAPARSRDVAGLATAYGSAFALTLTNPATILTFAVIFAGLNPGAGAGPVAAFLVVGGVFAGSAAWWLVLSSATDRLRGRLTPVSLGWVNRVSGVVIVAFGVVALVH